MGGYNLQKHLFSNVQKISKRFFSTPKSNFKGFIYPRGSLAFGLRPLYPHFLHTFAVGGFLALHFKHILIWNILFSASSNLAIISLLYRDF